MIYRPCHVVFSKPKWINGVFHRGFMTTDNLDNLDQQFDRKLWAMGIFFHAPVEPWFHPEIDLYFRAHTFQNCPEPSVTITDRDLTDETLFYPLPDHEPEYDVLFNMNWMPFKRHELFLETLQYAKQSKRPIRVLWFGYHYDTVSQAREKKFVEEVAQANLDVTFLPADFNRVEINRRYSLAKCSVICSKGEGGPRVFAESLFAGLPLIVTSDTKGGVPESLSPKCGITCEATAAGLASAIWNVLDHLDEYSTRTWALDHLTRSASNVRLREALRNLSLAQSKDRAPINWQEAEFTEYDWQCKKELLRQAESEFLESQSS